MAGPQQGLDLSNARPYANPQLRAPKTKIRLCLTFLNFDKISTDL